MTTPPGTGPGPQRPVPGGSGALRSRSRPTIPLPRVGPPRSHRSSLPPPQKKPFAHPSTHPHRCFPSRGEPFIRYLYFTPPNWAYFLFVYFPLSLSFFFLFSFSFFLVLTLISQRPFASELAHASAPAGTRRPQSRENYKFATKKNLPRGMGFFSAPHSGFLYVFHSLFHPNPHSRRSLTAPKHQIPGN